MSRLSLIAILGLAALPAVTADYPPLLYQRDDTSAAESRHEEEPPSQRRWQSRRIAKSAESRLEAQPAAAAAPPATTTPKTKDSPLPEVDVKEVEPARGIVADAVADVGATTVRPVPAPSFQPPAPPIRDIPPREPWRREAFAPPTPEGVENYRRRLESRLLEKYNNIPEFAGQVSRVAVVLSGPPETSVDGTMIRANFDQLVYDSWGKRIPALEKEYFVVTFGAEGVRQVRSDPSIRVGLDLEKTYSERAPLAADPFRNAPDTSSFAPAPQVKMPAWWRPEYPELD